MDWTPQQDETPRGPTSPQAPGSSWPPSGSQYPEVEESPEFPREASRRGGGRRAAVFVAGGALLLAAVGGGGFAIGQYLNRPSATSAFGRLPANQFPSGRFGVPVGGSGSTGVTPTLPTNAPSEAAAAKIATKVDVGVVDISTTSSYQSSSAAGTGMILSSSGLVLTNNHVIDGATSIRVRVVSTNATFSAKVLGYSVGKDVALLQLRGDSGLTPVTTADSRTVSSHTPVVGIGNAGGVGGTPSFAPGAVIATNQSLTASDPSNLTGAEQLTNMIQVAANIEPGDSGGPLANAQGQVIGMDTAGASTGPGAGAGDDVTSAGQGYAIPINEALAVVRSIESGTSSASVHVGATPLLGVEISPTLSGFGESVPATVAGVQLAGVAPGTPAASSGLTGGDVVTALNGQSVTSATQLSAIVQRLVPGDDVKVSYTTPAGNSTSVNVRLFAGPAL